MRKKCFFPRWCGCILLCAFLVLGTACTVAEIAYSFADRLILHEISSRYGLTNAQEVRVLASIRERLYEHQQQELPLYEDWLQAAQSAIGDKLTRTEVDKLNEQAEFLFQQGVRKTLPLFAGVLADLSADQIAYMREETLESYRDRAEEIAEREGQERIEKLTERLQEWLGDLSATQKQIIRHHVAGWPENSEQWLKWRQQRFLALAEFLETKPPQEEIHAYLRSHWLDYETMPESLAKSWQQSRQNYLALILELDATLSVEQRAQMIEKLEEWITIINNMQAENIKSDSL